MERDGGYDVNDDVHGEIESLIALLAKLGYSDRDGTCRCGRGLRGKRM